MRSGFTLLEMILALAIGLVLMWALYMHARTRSSPDAGGPRVDRGSDAGPLHPRAASADDVGGSLGRTTRKQADGELRARAPAASTTSEHATHDDHRRRRSSASSNHGTSTTSISSSCAVGRVPRDLGADGRGSKRARCTKVSDLRRITYWVDGRQGAGLPGSEPASPATDIDVDVAGRRAGQGIIARR